MATNGSVTIPKWVVGFFTTLLVSSILGVAGMGIGLSSAVHQNKTDIAVIQGNRFTSGDAVALLQSLPDQHDYDLLRASIERIEARLERLYPNG